MILGTHVSATVNFVHCETGGSQLVPAQQRAPVWEQNPKITYLPWHLSGQSSSYITLDMTLVFNITFYGQAISSHFYPFLSISDTLSAISSHLWFFFCKLEAFMALIQPFPKISIHLKHFQSFLDQSVIISKYRTCFNFSVFLLVPSWDSVPILMCHQVQAPH